MVLTDDENVMNQGRYVYYQTLISLVYWAIDLFLYNDINLRDMSNHSHSTPTKKIEQNEE